MSRRDHRGRNPLCAGTEQKEVLARLKLNQTGINRLTRFDTEPFASRLGAEIKAYHPGEYFSEEEQRQFDPCAQYAIIAAKEAIEESGLPCWESILSK